MAIKKIPCGGFCYDDESIIFEDGVMKPCNDTVVVRKIKYDMQKDVYVWDDEHSFIDTINYIKSHPDKVLMLYAIGLSKLPSVYIPKISGSASKPNLIIESIPSFNYVNNTLVINTSKYYITATESTSYLHRYDLTDLTVVDTHN